ncbi:YciI family protein [Rhodopirellula sp. JC639]|uniref:YciI family protein n=1 Tax=Stieleria mannarensis TaxID=2755585 RepID=UPI00160015D6|nr:YciI family protein [Rhodopirellula sp. JC639]
MKVMVIVKATASSEAGELPSEALLKAMGQFNEELVNARIMKAGEGLKPTSEAKRVHFRGTDRTVTDGPFAETKELIAGYWLWEVKSMEEAVEWVKRCPNPMMEDSDIDIRPIYEMEDFAEVDPQSEVAKHEDGLRSRIATHDANVQPYLFFGGRCEEALEFYQQAIGASVSMCMRFNESPAPAPEGMIPEGFENKIMHASFEVGKMTIMASDGCGERSAFGSFRLTLSMPSAADAELVFNALAEGGTVDMPLTKTFWSPRYGMVTDKFGLGWMVMVPGEPC